MVCSESLREILGPEHGSMSPRDPRALTDISVANSNLMALADLFDISGDEVPQRLAGL